MGLLKVFILIGTLVEKFGYTKKYMQEFEMESRTALGQTKMLMQMLEAYSGSFEEAESFINSTRAEPIFEYMKVKAPLAKESFT